jgi:hypothetical protein
VGSTTKNAITVGNFSFGVSGGDDYGPSSTTGFYNGITPPVGGYTIYNEVGGNIYANVAYDDSQCVFFLKSLGCPNTTISDCLTWASTQSYLVVRSSEYQLSDLNLSFTLNSNDILGGTGNYNSWNGNSYPVALGTNGVDGFTLTNHVGDPIYSTYASYVPYTATIGSPSIVLFFNGLVSSGKISYTNETTLWNVEWGPGSTHVSGVVSLQGVGNINDAMLIAPLDTTDLTWNQSGNNTTTLPGTYLFPAKFTLIEPTFNKGGWC